MPGIKTRWSATARGRLDYVTGPSVLYVTGGVGFVHVTDYFGGFVGTPLVSPTGSSTTTTGGAFGVGIETKLSRNWSEKTEYIYIDGGGTHSFLSAVGAAAAPTTTNFTHNFQAIKTGLNYKLDGNWDGLPFFNAPMLATNHNWNGFYVGGNAGIGTSLTQTTNLNAAIVGTGEDLTGTGFTGGGQAGYNYMLWNKYLVGVAGDFGAFSMHRTVTDWSDTAVTFSEKTSWLGTLRGRVGVTTGPALLYFTGGLAFCAFPGRHRAQYRRHRRHRQQDRRRPDLGRRNRSRAGPALVGETRVALMRTLRCSRCSSRSASSSSAPGWIINSTEATPTSIQGLIPALHDQAASTFSAHGHGCTIARSSDEAIQVRHAE